MSPFLRAPHVVLIEQIVVQILDDGRCLLLPQTGVHIKLVLHAVLQLRRVPHKVVLDL